MGEMITKPDTNPIIPAVLNFFVAGALGYFLIGQKKKAIISLVVYAVSWICTLGVVTLPWVIITAYDGYLLGQKLQAGESIGENENGLSFLDAIFKD
ncbi:MAG: hypothetical protein ACJAZO_002665 [Myxococcota bacterium]|jgi:hypothetical protein